MVQIYPKFSNAEVITVYPKYFLTILNALYNFNDQELSPKDFYRHVFRHFL